MFIFRKVVEKQQLAAAVIQGKLIAKAYEAAAINVLIATGGTAAIGALAGFASVKAAFAAQSVIPAGGGQAHDGITSVSRGGSFEMLKGERIVRTNQNSDLTDFLANERRSQSDEFNLAPGGRGSSSTRFEINVQALDVESVAAANWDEIVENGIQPAVDRYIERGGKVAASEVAS